MRNKHSYTHIGGQLGRKVDKSQLMKQSLQAELHHAAMVEDMKSRGFVDGIHDELVFAAHPSWTDEELAALIRDVRRVPDSEKPPELRWDRELPLQNWPLTAQVITAVEQTQIVKNSCPAKALIKVVDVVQGDQVFETAASDPVTVLYVHDADYFVSLMVVREGNAPFIIPRHSEAVIYKSGDAK